MEISIQDAYAEACRALGEALVRERLLMQEFARRDQETAKQAETVPGQ